MKKQLLMLMVATLVFSGSAGVVSAKQGGVSTTQTTVTTSADVTVTAETEDEAAVETEVEAEAEVEAAEDTQAAEEGKGKGSKGSNGLLKAIENTKDKPAGAVIANLLLTKYAATLTPELKAQLEAIVEPAEALTEAADLLEEQGDVEAAAEVQAEAVKADVTNINFYKKLGKLYNKLNKTGVKLYVNGEHPNFEVAPFIRNGSTLVPFRAIAESLKAEVSWNPEERSVTVTRDGISVKLVIGSTTAYVNGKEVSLEVPSEIVDGSTVVPVRFISEALQAAVVWEPETESVVILDGEAAAEVEAAADAAVDAEATTEAAADAAADTATAEAATTETTVVTTTETTVQP